MILSNLYVLRYATVELGIWVWLTWAMLAILTIGLIRTVKRQNREYQALLSHDAQGEQDAGKHALYALALLRGKVLCGLWVMIAGMLIAYDISHAIAKARNYGEAASLANAPKPDDNPYLAAEVPPLTPAESALAQEAITRTAQREAAPPNSAKIKSSYEDALVSYFILRRCRMVEKGAYPTLYHALLRALYFTQAREAMAKDVLSAATGTYQSLYSDIDCRSEAIKNTQADFALFMKKVSLE